MSEKKPLPKFPLVRVEWLDAGSVDAWTAIKAFGKMNKTPCVTVGHLISETEGSYVVAGTIDTHGQHVACTMEIPFQQVKKITKLRAK